MKRLNVLFAALILFCIAATTMAQTPQAIKYQAIARNTNGEPIANQNVSFRISILQGSAEGTPVYQETQTATTNQFGLATLSIGAGNVVTGQFNSIAWGNGTYFAKIEFDPKGGTEYAFMGTSQLLSVPYSLYSDHAKIADNLPVFPIKASLQATNSKAPFDSPETGMLVYNTDSAGTIPNNVVPGYYYNAGTKVEPNWVLLSAIDKKGETKRLFSLGSNITTYGGLSQDSPSTSVGSTVGTGGSGSDNTAFGTNAFNNTMTGTDNTGVGYIALTTLSSGDYNTATGSAALANNSDASYNTADGGLALYHNDGTSNSGTGFEALYSNTNGYNNTGNGTWALFANQTGYNNTATGEGSLFNSTGDNNTANGMEALFTNTKGSNNTGLGFNALFYNTTGTNNTATGYLAMSGTSGSSTGSSNTAFGAYSLNINSTGDENTAIGDSALALNTRGVGNAAVGYSALYTNNSGSGNTAIGYSALYTNSVSESNTAVGNSALYSEDGTDVDAGFNTAVGSNALYSTTSGTNNTSIGNFALYTNSTGFYNTAIGTHADVGSNNLSYATAIGADAIVSTNNSLVLGGTGSSQYAFVGIGTTSPVALLDLKHPSTNAVTNCHIKSEGTKPTITVTTANGITAAAIATGSTDVKGTITTTGTNTAGGVNTVLTITFNKTFNVAPIVLITSASASAQACTYYVTSTTTTFVFNFTGGGAAPSFNYFVIE